MANVALKSTWVFELGAEDVRLVLRALGGRLSGDEVEAARELGDNLTRARAAASRALASQLSMHEDNIHGSSG